MEVPCVRAPRTAGEETRQRLADEGLIDREFDIVVDDADIFIPVTDSEAVPDDFSVVRRDVPARTPQRMPEDLLSFAPSYERIGDVVVVDEDDAERAAEIAEAILESDLPARTVLNRASKVKGELRVRDWDVLAVDESAPNPEGRTPTETVHREYGYEFVIDLASVYFSPRLATERHRVVEQVREGEHAFDMFAGVGPFAIPMADHGADVVACDLNDVAVEYLRENAARNKVEDRITAVQGDVRETADDWTDWADRIVMNLPHSADEFVETAVRLAGDDAVVHYYDIQSDEDPFGPGERALRDAAGEEYEVDVLERHEVRSYAPHELNVCLDVRLTRV